MDEYATTQEERLRTAMNDWRGSNGEDAFHMIENQNVVLTEKRERFRPLCATSRMRKFLRRALSLLSVSMITTCLLAVLVPSMAYAYVDPSVMTYTIQALAGVAVALGAVAGVAFRRSRKWLMKLFRIDTNAHKDIEPDVHRVTAVEEPSVIQGVITEPVSATHSAMHAKKRVGAERLSWPFRIMSSLLAVAFLVYTVFVVAPYEIVASNTGSLVFGLSDVWAPVAIAAVVLTVCLTLVLSVFRGKAFDIVLAVIVAVGVCAYVQALFFNTSLPSADGSAVMWEDYGPITAVSTIVWILLVAFFVAFAAVKTNLFRGVALGLSACLIVVQSVGVASLFMMPQAIAADRTSPVEKPIVTEEGLFDVSGKSNVVVFILDKFDTTEMQNLLETDPDLLKGFTGFTYYPDSVGSMVPTMFALPYLVSAELPSPDEDFSHYVSNRYERGTFLDDIMAQGYSVGIYSDSLWDDDGQLSDKTINIHPLGERRTALDEQGAVSVLYKCALFRDLPWSLKPQFWFYTDEINKSMVCEDNNTEHADTPYVIDDLKYYRKLSSEGLSINPLDAGGAFRMIHLLGSHEPYVMNENCQPAGSEGATRDQQSIGSLRIVEEYLNQLKELGVYDDTTVIVLADHGDWYVSEDPITEPTSPLMMAKPANALDMPCTTSNVPVSHHDLFGTVMDATGGDVAKYGQCIFSLDKQDRIRKYYMTTTGESEGYVNSIIEFKIVGPVDNFANWSLTGQEWYYDSSEYSK